ncbi:MAG: hypothetical protein U5N55_04015 [Cypionkella sp.]|nr:hypothetical protein [Cypionkella sp.]
MQIIIEDKARRDSVALIEKTNSSSSQLVIPVSKAQLIHGMKEVLGDPFKTDVFIGDVMLAKTRDGLAVHTQVGGSRSPTFTRSRCCRRADHEAAEAPARPPDAGLLSDPRLPRRRAAQIKDQGQLYTPKPDGMSSPNYQPLSSTVGRSTAHPSR